MSSENSVSYEEEIIIEKEITREVDVEVEENKPEIEIEKTVEVVTEPITTTVEVTREITNEKSKNPSIKEGSFETENSYEYSVEKVVEVDRVVETEVIRNGETIESDLDKKLHLNYRKNRLTTFVKTMEFFKKTESSRFVDQSEMMKRSIRFKNFGEFLRLFLSDENRLKEYTEDKLKKEDVKMARRMIVDEDILEKMRHFYMVNSQSNKRVKEYSDLIDFARTTGDKNPDDEARLVDRMEKGLESSNNVQFGMYGLRTTDETEGLWGVGYVPYEKNAKDALDEEGEEGCKLIELPPTPIEGEEDDQKWRESGFFVRNRSRKLAFNDSLIMDRNSSEVIGTQEKKDNYESGDKIDFEYEIFGHMVIDLNNSLLWKNIRLNGEKICNERKISVRKFLGKKKVTKVIDEELGEEIKEFIESKDEIQEKASDIRKEYENNSSDLSKREEKISEFFKIVRKANIEDLHEMIYTSEKIDSDAFMTRELMRERNFSSTVKTTKQTRVMSLIEGVTTETVEVKKEEIENENSNYDNTINPFVQEIFQVDDTYISLYLMEVLEEFPEKRKQALKEIIERGDFVFLKEEYRNLGMTVETDILDDRMFENDKWLYMVYFKGGYKRLFGLMDARFSHYRTDLVKIYEPGHTGERYKSNFFNLTSKITERTNESISSEDSIEKNQLVKWNFTELENQGSNNIDWTSKNRLLHDIRQLSIREFMWSMGYLRNDSSIEGRIMPYWPFSPVRKDEINLYLEKRPQLKMIMMKEGKEVISREREVSVSSTSSHEYERIYEKEVEKEINIEVIENGKKTNKIIKKKISSESSQDIIVNDDDLPQSDTTLETDVTSTKSTTGISKTVILAMIVWGSIVVGSVLGSKIVVTNLIPPPISTPVNNPTPYTSVDPAKRVNQPVTNPPAKVQPTVKPSIKPKPSKPTRPMTSKSTTTKPHMKFTKTKIKAIPKKPDVLPKKVPPKSIKSIPVVSKTPAPTPKTQPPSPQKVIVHSSHENHTFVVEHHYIQPQFIITPNQANQHPPIINISNETNSESTAQTPAPTPVPVVQPQVPIEMPVIQKRKAEKEVSAPAPVPTIITPQPHGPIHVQPKIEFNPIITPTINVPVNIQTPPAPKQTPSNNTNKTYNTTNNHTNNHYNTVTPTETNVEKIIETHGQVEEMNQANKNQNNLIVSDENELPDINALVNDIKMNVSTDQEMTDLQNLIIHRDTQNKSRKAISEPQSQSQHQQPVNIIIQHNNSNHHHHHHHSSGPSFVGFLTTTIKKHPHRSRGSRRSRKSHHRMNSELMGASHSHHRHHNHHHGFISQFKIKSENPQPEPVPIKIKKSTEGKIKSSDEMLNSISDNYKKNSAAAVSQPTLVPVSSVYNCSQNSVVPLSINPNCGKKKHKKHKKHRKKHRKLKSSNKRHKKVTKYNNDFDDFTEPMFNNQDYLLDSIIDNDSIEKNKKWNHRFNMFNYFNNKKTLKTAKTNDDIEDMEMMPFDYPKMSMDLGLNENDLTSDQDLAKNSEILSV